MGQDFLKRDFDLLQTTENQSDHCAPIQDPDFDDDNSSCQASSPIINDAWQEEWATTCGWQSAYDWFAPEKKFEQLSKKRQANLVVFMLRYLTGTNRSFGKPSRVEDLQQ